MDEIIIFAKLTCAHLCADFFFQPDRLNTGKRSGGTKGLACLLIHSLIHALTAYLLVAQWYNWVLPLAIFVTHFAIDYLKCRWGKDTTTSFVIDQSCHLLVLLCLWRLMFYSSNDGHLLLPQAWSTKTWCIATAYMLVLKPSSILLRLFLKRWTPTPANGQSLPNAGQWIGYIERVLTLTFILVGSIECVGFLLTAKSVFRFGELNKSKEIKTTEYVLIGTLSSFAIAIMTGIILCECFQ